jgi:hypothetical protein
MGAPADANVNQTKLEATAEKEEEVEPTETPLNIRLYSLS